VKAKTVLRLLFVVWCLVVGIRFCDVVIKSINNPFNTGADWTWALTWILICALVVIFKKSIQLLPILAAILILVLSGSWLPALLALWLIFITTAIGGGILLRLVGDDFTVIEYLVCGMPLGFGAVAMGMLLLGLSGELTRVAVWIFLVVLSGWSVRFWRRHISMFGRPRMSDGEAVLCTLMASVAVVYLFWAVAPEVQFDALNYHLHVPAKYLQNARIIELPYLHAYLARWVELFFVACLAIGGAATTKMWVFFVSLIVAAGAYALGCRALDRRVGLWAAALFMTTPLIGWLFGTAYIDNILALFVTSSFVALVRWQDSKKAGLLYAASLLAGVGVGSKVNIAFIYVLIAPFVIWQLRSRLRVLAIAAVAASVFAVPTYALTYSFTGNPVFPLLNGVFKSPKWPVDNKITNASDYGLPMNARSLIRFPFRLTFDTIRFGEALPRGGVGLTLLLALPFSLFLLQRERPAVRLLIAAVMSYLLVMFYTMQYARYYLLILPLVAVLAVITSFHLASSSRWLSVGLLLIVIVQPLIHSVHFWNIPERFPIRLALGFEERQSFLRRALPGYEATAYLNSVTTDSDKILGVGTENLRFYLRPELQTWQLSMITDPIRALADMEPGDSLAAAIRRLGMTHLLVTREAAQKPAAGFPYLDPKFLQSHATLVFQDDYTIAYRMR
jgi:hypothetical protein